jgi:uncharacterized membrane protein
VEAALSDVILLGTAEQVKLAVAAANDLVAGRKVETGDLVIALRSYIREVLDLEPMDLQDMPRQGPARGSASGRGAAKSAAGGGGRQGGGGGRGGGGGGGGGMGAAAIGGTAVGRAADEER